MPETSGTTLATTRLLLMQPVTPPPVRNPLDLIAAKLHVASNDFFLELTNILGGIVSSRRTNVARTRRLV